MHESWHLRYPSVVGEPPSRRRVDTQLNGGSLIYAILLPLIEITGLVDRIDLSRLSHLPWLIGLSPNHLACPAESMYIKCILTFVLQTTKLGPTETSVPERACESCDLQLGHSLAFARNSRSALICAALRFLSARITWRQVFVPSKSSNGLTGVQRTPTASRILEHTRAWP